MNRAIGQDEQSLQPKDDEDHHDDADPRRPADRTGPVAAIGDPAVAAEHGQPHEWREGERHRETHQRRTDEPGLWLDDRVAGGDDHADENPDDHRRGQEAEVGQPVARFHDERV